jgi:hypothetical protein
MSWEFEKFYGAAEKAATKTPYQLYKENLIDIDIDFDDWSALKRARYLPVSILMPALGSVNRAAYRHKMLVDASITIIAVIRFKQSAGSYPENLGELVAAGYLKKISSDPFSDKPLVYKKTDGSFVLYSIGFNFKDDGGQVYRDEKGKVKLWADDADAVFWPVQK